MEQKTGEYLKRALVILAVLAGILLVRPAGAADRLVPSQYATIQAAITAAANYDTIIVAPGTYNENISFNGKNITLHSTDPDDPEVVSTTIIQGTGTTSVVKFTSKENSSCLLAGFTITGGVVTGSGGGIAGNNTDTCPTISRCVITGNSATSAGGGIWGCKGKISRCVIAGNTAVSGGGIAACNGLILNCLICNNQADYGGGIHNCDGSILNCTITQNTGTTQGVLNGCDGKLTNCIIWGNTPDTITENTSIFTYSCWPEGTSGTGNISIDPNFVSSSDFHLAAGSGCIDTGLTTTASLTVYEDLEGNFRPQDGDRNGSEIADMGAYEVPGFARLMMTEPEGGEHWASGSIHRLAWESRNYEGTIDLSYSLNAGTDWLPIADDIANTGSYQWTVPDANSDQCLVAIAAHEEPAGIVYGQQEEPFAIHPDATGTPVEALWKTQGHDVQRSGLADFAGPQIGCIKWQYHTPEAVTTGLVVGADNNLHIVCEDGILYTVDADGQEVWQFDSGSELIETPSVGPDGSVYFGAKNGKLYALDKQGQLRWTHNTGGIVYCSPAVADDGKVFFGSQDGTLYALGADGSELWRFTVPTASQTAVAMQASPAIGQDGNIYIGSLFRPVLYALNPNDGSIVWQTQSLGGAGICTSPVVADNGTIYLNTKDDTHLLAIHPADGTVLWSIDLRDPVYGPFDPADPDTFSAWNPPALGPDGTIYVSFDDSYVRAVNPYGALKWITCLGMGEGFSLTVDAAGRIYAAGEDSSIYVLEPQEGRVASVLNGIFYNILGLFTGMEVTGTDDWRYAGQTNTTITAYDPNNHTQWQINLNSTFSYPYNNSVLLSLGMVDNGILYALAGSPSGAADPIKRICIIDTQTGQILDIIERQVGSSFVAQKTPMSYPVIAGNGLLYFTDFHRTVSAVSADACGESPLSLHHPCDLDGNQTVDFVDYALFLNTWWMCTDYDNTQICQYRPTWRNRPWAYYLHFNEALIYQPGDFNRDYYVTLEDLMELAENWMN